MNVVCVGAHPDDCEVLFGGTAVKWARAGWPVLFVSVTNGDAGHHEMAREALALRRIAEAHASAARGGVESLVLDHHDGEVTPSLELRKEIVRIIRQRQADIVVTHRPFDYHPDHRYTSIVVQDAAFMVTVPHFCPETPRLKRNPVFLYGCDTFRNPVPFRPDIAVNVTDVMDVKLHMLDAMESQVYEWLPWLNGSPEAVPDSVEGRRRWLREVWEPYLESRTRLARPAAAKWYGEGPGLQARYLEAFEICEYGRQPSDDEIRDLFSFLPAKGN
jgi:LmbE family N-acetylglucosaminyl deacetylase